jgi:ABC-type nitrate/sulfonate/bicarbonate transport system substrate-binding protein
MDVQIVEAGGTLNRLQALKADKIAATALNEPADSEAKLSGLPLLADLKADVPWIFTAIAVDRTYLEVHREQMSEFLKAWIEGIYIALSDAPRAKAILGREFTGFSPAALEATYSDFRARVPRDAEPARAGAEIMFREVPHGNATAKIEDYIDTSLLAQLRREGFFDTMKRRYRVE